ncbi:hypothetical protein [Sphingorhabdus sp. Alg231-15]|uniref:hypothetical protein n=1 Tax=Sphingorhabdus sp. Alg231-15 TaxID=1922222 RepID=UPI000D54E04B
MSLFDNPTQAFGIVFFSFAALSCAFAMRIVFWRWLAVLYLLFAAEISLGGRHFFHLKMNDVMQSVGIYADRAIVQWILIVAVISVLLLFLSRYRDSLGSIGYVALWRSTGGVATGLLLLLFATELISVHEIDAFIYQTVFGVMLIGWMWATLAMVVASAAFFDQRRSRYSASDKAQDKEPV